jgi:hypothetical protein
VADQPRQHVDIISNDPHAGSQQLLAKIELNGDPELEVHMAEGAGTDEAHMTRYLDSLTSRSGIDRHADPQGFLHSLSDSVNGIYVVASAVHDEAHCPFVGQTQVRISSGTSS